MHRTRKIIFLNLTSASTRHKFPFPLIRSRDTQLQWAEGIKYTICIYVPIMEIVLLKVIVKKLNRNSIFHRYVLDQI